MKYLLVLLGIISFSNSYAATKIVCNNFTSISPQNITINLGLSEESESSFLNINSVELLVDNKTLIASDVVEKMRVNAGSEKNPMPVNILSVLRGTDSLIAYFHNDKVPANSFLGFAHIQTAAYSSNLKLTEPFYGDLFHCYAEN